MKLTKDDNIRIFNDTLRIIDNNKYLKEAIEKSTMEQQYFVDDTIPTFSNRYEEDAKVVISKSSSFDAARKYNGSVAVLNFASATNPGGGVIHGSFAQEECLCRCSTLYRNLIADEALAKFYTPHRNGLSPLHNDDIIYTPGVTIIKSDSYNKLYSMPKVNVITCAAPNLRENPQNTYNNESHSEGVKITDQELLELHIKRARKILATAASFNNDTVILGAFGCGAFKNDPNIVAEAYKTVLPEFIKCFKTIEFAIYCRNSEATNYETFKKVFE